MKLNKPAAALPPSPRAKLGPWAAALFPILLLAASVLSCLKPIGFGPEDFDPTPADSTPSDPASIDIKNIVPATGRDPEKEITATSEYMGTITWFPAITNDTPYAAKFKPFQDYTATIDLAMKGGRLPPPAGTKVTVEGALSAVYNAAGIITAKFPRTHYPVNSINDLKDAITALPTAMPAGVNNKNIIDLTQTFYTTVNGNTTAPYYVPIGIDTVDNTIPCTVRGLGKGYSDPELKVGVLLANNNITLEEVRIVIPNTDSTKGVPQLWTLSSSYRTAILIGRHTTEPSPPTASFYTGSGIENIAVKNCNISFEANDSMIAGIYIDHMAQNISITDNTVSVVSGSGNAAQAIAVCNYDDSISIIHNGLKSQNNAATHGNPATAIFMQVDPKLGTTPSGTPLINGNAINGNPTYDFYINIFSSDNSTDRTGIPALVADNDFATPDSKWMTADSTDTGSFYKKLLTTLLSQSRAGAGYGYLAMYFNTDAYGLDSDCVFECYSQETNGLTTGVTAIDFWGYTINTGAYSDTNQVRARLRLNPDGTVVLDSNDKPVLDTFHWWANGGQDTNISPSP
jgi:hypothetical protein